MTWREVDALEKDPGVVILPIGAIEQHGHHMPLVTDALIAGKAVELALNALPEDVPAWVLPTMPFGKSNEHVGFPGTIMLTAHTLLSFCHDVARSVAAAGFTRLMFVNGHGGNKALLEMAARDIRAELGLMTFVVMPPSLTEADRAALPAAEQRFGIHAGTVETALILADSPELVKMEQASVHYPAFTSDKVHLTAMPNVAWLSRDWSPKGHFGDATAATADMGERYWHNITQGLAAVIRDAAHFTIPNSIPDTLSGEA
jgi:creatinine amidohydrolase/Fe(II)-dependent formamide hydrolase-like protein